MVGRLAPGGQVDGKRPTHSFGLRIGTWPWHKGASATLRQSGRSASAVTVFPFHSFQRLMNPWGTPKKVVEDCRFCGRFVDRTCPLFKGGFCETLPVSGRSLTSVPFSLARPRPKCPRRIVQTELSSKAQKSTHTDFIQGTSDVRAWVEHR